jgi:hypothetical protein
VRVQLTQEKRIAHGFSMALVAPAGGNDTVTTW